MDLFPQLAMGLANGAGPSLMDLPQQLVNGLMIGAIYALIALGYTMVYGVLRLINFAHGEVFMLGAYMALFASWRLGYRPEEVAAGRAPEASPVNLVVMILFAMAVCAVVGALIEFFAYRPMRNQSRIAALITAIGVSLFLQYAGQLFLPASPPPAISERVNPYREPLKITLLEAPEELRQEVAVKRSELELQREEYRELSDGETDPTKLSDEAREARNAMFDAEAALNQLETGVQQKSATITVTVGKLVMLGTVLVLMAGLRFLVMNTSAGRAMRAVSLDFDTASLMGINPNKVVTFTFMTGSALAGAGAMMLVTFEGTPMTPFFGLMPGVKAFVAAVLGGIGNIPGAVLGGFLMGIAEALVTWVGYSQYKDAVAFVILIVVLMFRPGGLLGSAAVEKV